MKFPINSIILKRKAIKKNPQKNLLGTFLYLKSKKRYTINMAKNQKSFAMLKIDGIIKKHLPRSQQIS